MLRGLRRQLFDKFDLEFAAGPDIALDMLTRIGPFAVVLADMRMPVMDGAELLTEVCRYVTRPAIATERLSLSPDGKVVYARLRPWRDGTTHFVFDPLTFIERLAAGPPSKRPTGSFRSRFAGPGLTSRTHANTSSPTTACSRRPPPGAT